MPHRTTWFYLRTYRIDYQLNYTIPLAHATHNRDERPRSPINYAYYGIPVPEDWLTRNGRRNDAAIRLPALIDPAKCSGISVGNVSWLPIRSLPRWQSWQTARLPPHLPRRQSGQSGEFDGNEIINPGGRAPWLRVGGFAPRDDCCNSGCCLGL